MSTANLIWNYFIQHIGWVIFTLISGVIVIFNFWDKLKKLFSPRLNNNDKVRKRVVLRKEFEDYLIEKIWKEKYRNDVIIRDIKRIDTYPEVDESKKISCWFRIALLDTYHRGILVGLRVTWSSNSRHTS